MEGWNPPTSGPGVFMAYNDSRRFCPGCKKQRSLGQYKTKAQVCCNQCVLRGIDKTIQPAKA